MFDQFQHVQARTKILIVSSYDENYELAVRQIAGIESGLIKGGVPLTSVYYKSFFMDTNMNYVTDDQLEYISEFTLNLTQKWDPFVVIVAGDVAFEKVAIKYEQMRQLNTSMPNIPFVFCGINQDLSNVSSMYPGLITTSTYKGTVSGIATQVRFQNRIDLGLVFVTNPYKIAFVFDASLQSKYQSISLEKLSKDGSVNTHGYDLEIYRANTFDRFKLTMLDLQRKNYMIVVIQSLKLFTDEHLNVTVLPHVISNWVTANMNINIVGPISSGFSLNVRLSPNATCAYAGIMAAKLITKGTKYIEEPVYTNADPVFIETNIRKSRILQLKALTPQAAMFFNYPDVFTSVNIIDPTIYTNNPFKLMIVHSYSQTYSWPIFQGNGFITGLDKQSINRSNYYLKTFWMDAKETYNTASGIRYMSSIAMKDLETFRPNVIYATDDEALRSVMLPYVNQTLNTPWQSMNVFTGINVDPSQYPLIGNLDSPLTTITGIIERYNFNQLINISKLINPNIETMSIVLDTSPTSAVTKEQIDVALEKYKDQWPPSRSFTFQTFEDFKKFILTDSISNSGTDLLWMVSYAGFKYINGTGVPGGEVLSWLSSNRNGTEVSQLPTFTVDGGLIALGQDPIAAGSGAALYAARMLSGVNASQLSINSNVSISQTINSQRAYLTNSNLPTQVMVAAQVYQSTLSTTMVQLVASDPELIIGYITFCLFLILGVLSVCLIQFIYLLWPKEKGKSTITAIYRTVFYLFLLLLCVLRLFQLMVELNVRSPSTNLIVGFVLYKLGSIFYIGSMMIECLMWISIIKTYFENEYFIKTLKGYCVILFLINTAAQIISLIVFSYYASSAVANNHNKIIAYNQGLYFTKYGSIKYEIIQTDYHLRLSNRSSQLVTGIIGILHSVIFFVVGILFLKAVISSSKKTSMERRKYLASKILTLTTLIGVCSTAALIYFIVLTGNTKVSNENWMGYLFDLIIFEWIPSFALISTYIYTASESIGNKNTHIKLKDEDAPSSTSKTSK